MAVLAYIILYGSFGIYNFIWQFWHIISSVNYLDLDPLGIMSSIFMSEKSFFGYNIKPKLFPAVSLPLHSVKYMSYNL